MVILTVLAVIVAVIGAASLSNATAGVGGIALACLVAIFARMAQAGQHHSASMRAAGVVEPVKQSVDPSVMMRCTACSHEFVRGPKACPSCGAVFT